MADVRRRFGEAVREERLRKNLSQERLGQLADLDRTYISGIERGLRNPSLVNLEKIARALDTNLSRLLRKVP